MERTETLRQAFPPGWRALALDAREFELLGPAEATEILTARFHLFSSLGWDWKTALLLAVQLDPAA